MIAFALEEPGKVSLVERPIPQIKSNEALIRLDAAAFNRRDHWIRMGLYAGIVPSILGSDGCGVVVEIGDTAENQHWLGKQVILNPNQNWGDDPRFQSKSYRILGMPADGTLAEYIAIPIDRLHEKPTYLNAQEAAALPLGGLTAFRACFYKGNIEPGMNVLVTGVGGGVAQFAAQFAIAAQANVFVTSGSIDKIDTLTAMGASGGVSYKEAKWHEKLLRDSGGFDVIIDSAGGPDFNTLLRILKPAGTLVFYGATLGAVPQLDMPRIFFGQFTIKGTTMGSDTDFTQMLDFVAKHQIHPIIEPARPLSDALAAINDLKEGKFFGKIVLNCR
ncbi:MAG: zinc-binding dehydrogenase [Bacteroidia bacterium]|nr:zinc-binding dehydrogenase [Bacteroidia bacterium]